MHGGSPIPAPLPLVTVVVVSYNHGPYLDTCLNSVFGQTYPNIQCVVVDNASSDNSREIIERYYARAALDRSFETILSPVNSHLTKAMIAGFERAAGAYVIFVDGDDYFMPTCVEAHVQAHLVSRIPVGFTSVDMYQSRGADLVTGTSINFGRFVMSGRGQRAPFCRMRNLEPFHGWGLSDRPVLEEKDLHFVGRSMTRDWVWSPTSGLCFRREPVELMFAYAPNILSHTDNYLARGISSLTGSITIDRPLAVYRLHSTNMFTKHPALSNFLSNDKGEVAVSDVDVSREIVACFKQQAHELAARLENLHVYIEAVDMVSRVGPGLKAPGSRTPYVLQFLRENKALLEAAFGVSMYRRWVRRYTYFHRERVGFVPDRLLKRLKSRFAPNDRSLWET